MGKMVIVGYRPKPGKLAELEALMLTHVAILREQGLATERPSIVMRAQDDTLIEVFEWVPEQSISDAHTNPAVQEMWAAYNEVCEYIPAGNIPEMSQVFSSFSPLN